MVTRISARHLRATMPDQTRQPLSAVSEQNSTLKNINASSKNPGQLHLAPFAVPSSALSRRYSQPQGEPDSSSSASSSASVAVLEKFQRSLGIVKPSLSDGHSHITRISSSPCLSALSGNLSSQNNNGNIAKSSAQSSGDQSRVLPEQSLLAKMVGSSNKSTSIFSSLAQKQKGYDSASSSSVESASLVKNDNCRDANMAQQSSTSPISQASSATDSFNKSNSSSNNDCVDSGSSFSGLNFLSKTRQFGAWLTTTVEGEKVEVTKTDLNVFAPTTF